MICLMMTPVHAQMHGSPDQVMWCEGLGNTVGLTLSQRNDGVEESENEGVQLLSQIGEHMQTDLLGQVNQFLNRTRPLSAQWSALLYTHACMYQYTTDEAQLKLISLLIPVKCEAEQPDLMCLQQLVAQLPPTEAI